MEGRSERGMSRLFLWILLSSGELQVPLFAVEVDLGAVTCIARLEPGDELHIVSQYPANVPSDPV